jgi:hypothetical protein
MHHAHPSVSCPVSMVGVIIFVVLLAMVLV